MSIVVYGNYGVGKTALLEVLEKWAPFCQCVMTTTRAPRDDDAQNYFEYTDERGVSESVGEGEFALLAKTNGTFYGYKRKSLASKGQINLLYGNPEFDLSQLRNLVIRILIDGDSARGLKLRGDRKLAEQRELSRRHLDLNYFQTSPFRRQMDLIVENRLFAGANWRAAHRGWCCQIATLSLVKLWIKSARERDRQAAASLASYFTLLSARFPKCRKLAVRWGQRALYLGFNLSLARIILTWRSKGLMSDRPGSNRQIFSKLTEDETSRQLD